MKKQSMMSLPSRRKIEFIPIIRAELIQDLRTTDRSLRGNAAALNVNLEKEKPKK